MVGTMLLRPVDTHGILLWLLLTTLMMVGILWTTDFDPTFGILAASNGAAFLVMLIDKIQAMLAGRRLSERSLYAIALLGGSPGVIAGMYLLRHKSSKASFKLILFVLCLLQCAIVYFLYE